ncbi:MAG: DUF4349 domain-containing protein [Solirubrobacteraceae bacterium]
MRRREELDPVVSAELEALDAVLAGERNDPELSLIAEEARASAEPMPPGLALRLESKIAAGFPAGGGAKKRDPWWTKALAPAGGLAALVLLVVVLSSVGGGSGGDDASSSSGATDAVSQVAGGASAADSSSSSGSSEAAPTTAGGTSLAAPVAPAREADTAAVARKVQRAADLTISTPLGKLQDTSDEVTRTADRLGGYVQRSDVQAGSRGGQSTFDLRIPSARLDEALATLSKLGHVRARSQQSQDITGQFVSARSRLHDARAERQALLRALAAATTDQEIASINGRLEIARSRIAAAKADLFGARRAADYSHVNVTVLGVKGEDEGAAGSGDDEGWTPGRALGDAVDVLSVAAGVAIVTLAGLIPAALLALLALLAWRAYRRRSRELALDSRAV